MVGRGLWRPSSPTPLLKQVSSSRLHRKVSWGKEGVLNISREGVSTTSLCSFFSSALSLSSKKVLTHAQMELPVFPVCDHYPFSCHWPTTKRVWSHPLDSGPSDTLCVDKICSQSPLRKVIWKIFFPFCCCSDLLFIYSGGDDSPHKIVFWSCKQFG